MLKFNQVSCHSRRIIIHPVSSLPNGVVPCNRKIRIIVGELSCSFLQTKIDVLHYLSVFVRRTWGTTGRRIGVEGILSFETKKCSGCILFAAEQSSWLVFVFYL